MLKSFLFLLLVQLSLVAQADADCSKQVSTKDMRECAEIKLEKTEQRLAVLEGNLYKKMKKIMGDEYADNFKRLNLEWQSLTEKQCKHKREFYGRGSMGGISQLNCVDLLKKGRIKSLKTVYDEILSGR